uniref:Uncharacterized protein n=1 Tax=Helianthus annuus TaxID=4232 RepID=A0A251VC13_HELAN
MMSLYLTDVYVCGECRWHGLSIITKKRRFEDRVKSGMDLASLRRKEGLKIESRARVVREGSVT